MTKNREREREKRRNRMVEKSTVVVVNIYIVRVGVLNT